MSHTTPNPRNSDGYDQYQPSLDQPIDLFTPTFGSPTPSRSPSAYALSPSTGYPPARSSLNPRTPTQARRQPPATPQRQISRHPSTPSTLQRAANTALPLSPPSFQYTPPSSLTPRLHQPVELHPLSLTDSPFDDRHSIIVGLAEEEDPFEYQQYSPRVRRQRTIDGYKNAHLSPTSAKIDFGGMLEDVKPISEARRSMYPPGSFNIPASTLAEHPDLESPTSPTSPPQSTSTTQSVRPSFRGLFALTPTRDVITHLVPAVIVCLASSLIQPFMSIIIGDTFQIFEAYPLNSSLATSEDRAELFAGVNKTCLKLIIAGGASAILNYLTQVLWQRHGEAMTARLREAVYAGVQRKKMEWFDMGMGMHEGDGDDGETVGVGGLMAKFTRETDDVRTATSLAFGSVVQDAATFVLCFILAMVKVPKLALVTLSTIPLVVLVQIVTQVLVGPLYESERRAFAEASTNIERATSAISTVKAHNAQSSETARFDRLVNKGKKLLQTQALVWAANIGSSDFLILATFVLGFWYAAKIVRDGSASTGDVMTVFWASILAANYLQSIVPNLSILTKGKLSMASLRTIIQDDPAPSNTTTPTSPRHSLKQPRPLSIRGIHPTRCRGEFNLQNISFAYPSRPHAPVLRDITLFIPLNETTFIVGGSGSGKSTIAQLLLRLYPPATGNITLDSQEFLYLDEGFTRQHIAAVQQGCILFDMSVHDNVAMGIVGSETGRKVGDVSREEVVRACKMAMIDEFIAGLPDGYETKLGTGGSALSGGQRQRLAIARARIRDPTILILDEATSALDATSRVQVFESIKQWRRNRTTIVITHDLSQIVPDDFVYVMANGVVAEQGFRSDLIKKPAYLGVFASMAAEQAVVPLAPKVEGVEDDEEVLGDLGYTNQRERLHTPSFALRPGSVMYLGILDDYAKNGRLSGVPPMGERERVGSGFLNVPSNRLSWTPQELDRRRSRASLVTGRTSAYERPGSRMSRMESFERPRSRLSRMSPSPSPSPSVRGSFDSPHRQYSEKRVTIPHLNRTLSQNLDDDIKADLEITTLPVVDTSLPPIRGIFGLIVHFFPTLPSKPLLLLGLFGSAAHGITTPLWANYLSKLMQIVGQGGTSPTLPKYSFIVLSLCAAQGISVFTSEYFLYSVAATWTASLRSSTYTKVLNQDKTWFDESRNAPSALVQCLIKDADDMRGLMGNVIARFVTFVVMVGVGIGWAMIVSWRLTLVGLSLAPVFGGIVLVSTGLIGKMERVNKGKREAVAKTFYDSIQNVRGIRAMALDVTFRERFDNDAIAAEKHGKKAAWVIGIGGGATAAIPLLAQALLNWAGMKFMLGNYMNYAQMLQVFNLVLFSLTFATGLLDFIPMIAKITFAARDFDRLHSLSTSTRESEGTLRYPISGNVTFDRISFSYPSRPDAPIFTDLSFTLTPGECVAIVGPSGSGKSTIAALLQRLYEPTSGHIKLDKHLLSTSETKWLRNHIAIVSQSANLFDATVAENIAYGSEVPLLEIIRAAKDANIHEFITSLPKGYETNLGENASLISGGQAQRLQIARALVRRSNILVLDECTSALDGDNQRAILDTIVKIKDTRTTVFITHSVEAMRRCDRIICLGEGRVAEDGSFEELTRRGGVFAQLMKTGEWE